MKKFLRFEISGLSFLMWLLLFLLPHLNVGTGTTGTTAALGSGKIALAFLGLVVFSLPASFVIHQIAVSLFSPFRRWRFGRRKAPDLMKSEFGNLFDDLSDSKGNGLLVFIKAIHEETEITGHQSKKKTKSHIDLAFIRDELSNRYSYYYGRLESGFLSPLLGYLFYCLVYQNVASDKGLLLCDPAWPTWWMPLAALIVCVLLLGYMPALSRELDDIECTLIKLRSSSTKKLLTR